LNVQSQSEKCIMGGSMADENASQIKGVQQVPARLSMRELLLAVRARLGAAAAGLKTREELEAALRGEAPVPAPAPTPGPAAAAAPAPIVVRDFFIRQP
jgi:hypothetical protein